MASVFFPGKSHGHRRLASYSCKRVGHGLETKQQHNRYFPVLITWEENLFHTNNHKNSYHYKAIIGKRIKAAICGWGRGVDRKEV